MSRADIRAITQAALSISSISLLVKLLGMAREMLLARNLGVAPEVDAFVVAFGLVMLYVNVILGTVPAALVPVFVKIKTQEGDEAALDLGVWTTVLGLGLAFGAILVLNVFARPILAAAGPGLGPEARAWLVPVFRAMTPLIAFSTVSQLLAAVENAEGRFALPALVPGLTAVASVAGLAVFPEFRIWALIAGLLAGGLLEAAALAWTVSRRFRRKLGPIPWPHVKTFIRQFTPMVGGGLLMCSTALVDVGVASFLPAGGIAALTYANRIPQALMTLSAGALGTAVLPTFSRLTATRDWQRLRRVAGTFLLGTMALAAAAAVVLILASRPMIAAVFQRGAFTEAQTLEVARVQTMYFIQLPFYIGGIIVVRVISALGSNQVLLPAAAFSAAVNLGFDILLLKWMGLPGIALSTAVVHALTLVLLSAWAWRLIKRAEAAA